MLGVADRFKRTELVQESYMAYVDVLAPGEALGLQSPRVEEVSRFS